MDKIYVEQMLYRQMILEQRNDVEFVRLCQKNLKKKNIPIPIIYAGYINENNEIEYHPDKKINNKIKNNNFREYICE